MADLLLISDDLRRSRPLFRDLTAHWTCHTHDLYGGSVLDGTTPALIVSDVKALTSEAILKLRQILQRVRGPDVPFLCLLHDGGARTRVQAELLNASKILSASSAIYFLMNTLMHLQEEAQPISLKAQQRTDTARKFLCDVFVPNRPIAPNLVDVGTEIVANAVQELGIQTWVRAVQRFDDATHQHCLLVAGLASAFSGTLGLNATDRHRLVQAALLHDVGKIHVPHAILNKTSKLNAAEMAVMRTHPSRGHTMLVDQGYEATLLAVVRSHHEMLDGSGYPDKLTEQDIPDIVRLVTICDVYAALIEQRPYRAPMPGKQAFNVLEDMGGRLDADFVRAFHCVTKAFGSPIPPAASLRHTRGKDQP